MPFDYAHCRVCNVAVPTHAREWAQRQVENAHCGSPACTKAELIARFEAELIAQFGCCAKAEVLACVCAYAFRCPEHGVRHIGTHD